MLFQLVIPSGASVFSSVKQFCCPLKTSLVLCFGASNLLVGFWRGVNQYQGEKVCVESCSNPTYSIIHSYTSYTQSYRYTIKLYSCSLPELVPQSAGNTPNLTTIREPGPSHLYTEYLPSQGDNHLNTTYGLFACCEIMRRSVSSQYMV